MSLPISHAKIAELELTLDVAHYERVENRQGEIEAIILSGQQYACDFRHTHGYDGGYYEYPEVTYMRYRVQELKADQELIRKYCYS